jgi:hypothetical protein
MQISGVSLAVTWPCRLCLFRVLLCVSLCYKLSPFQALGKVTLHPCCQACVFTYSSCGRWVLPPLLCSFPPTATFTSFLLLITGRCCCSYQPPCLFIAHVGSGSSLLSCGVFLPPPLSQVFPLLVAGCAPPLPPESLQPALLVYLQSREGFPSPNLQRSGHPTLFPMCLYCSYCLLVNFSFFPGWRSVCPGGCGALAQACLWEYHGTTKLIWSVSSQAIWVPATLDIYFNKEEVLLTEG